MRTNTPKNNSDGDRCLSCVFRLLFPVSHIFHRAAISRQLSTESHDRDIRHESGFASKRSAQPNYIQPVQREVSQRISSHIRVLCAREIPGGHEG